MKVVTQEREKELSCDQVGLGASHFRIEDAGLVFCNTQKLRFEGSRGSWGSLSGAFGSDMGSKKRGLKQNNLYVYVSFPAMPGCNLN